MKSRVTLTVQFNPETGQATFPEDLNRWPFLTRVSLFVQIGDMISERIGTV